MSDCPYCDWRYDRYAEPWAAKPVGRPFPVVWDGRLRVPSGIEAADGRRAAIGAHICEAHPLEGDVLLIGPVEFGYL